MRGATACYTQQSIHIYISIHTPHAGSDNNKVPFLWRSGISIHTPHAGSDDQLIHQTFYLFIISIHTPHAGSDALKSRSIPKALYFNPHSPCGERLLVSRKWSIPHIFQSTLPMRGATALLFCFSQMDFISIHTPHAGSDSKSYRIHIKFKNKIYDIRNKNKL